MSKIYIDLSSDTVTRPTAEMRAFMSQAEVGDEQRREDPTVNRLVEMVCELLGKEAAIFLPSGTMCNQIAWRVYCRPGDEILADQSAHTRHYEVGGAAALSGATISPIPGNRGIYTATQLKAAIRPASNYFPRTRTILVEQTANLAGGAIWPLETIKEVSRTAQQHGLTRHMDGARLLNAVVATGIPAQDYGTHFDSLWLDFSKGLGAPVGATLAGSKEFIEEAWRWKHQFGGAMRQAGIIAAGAIYALNHHVARLAEDHIHAQILAEGLSQIEGIVVEPPETNMVFFDVSDLNITAKLFNEASQPRGLRVLVAGPTRLRAVTHLDVSVVKLTRRSRFLTRWLKGYDHSRTLNIRHCIRMVRYAIPPKVRIV